MPEMQCLLTATLRQVGAGARIRKPVHVLGLCMLAEVPCWASHTEPACPHLAPLGLLAPACQLWP